MSPLFLDGTIFPKKHQARCPISTLQCQGTIGLDPAEGTKSAGLSTIAGVVLIHALPWMPMDAMEPEIGAIDMGPWGPGQVTLERDMDRQLRLEPQ